MFRHDLTPHAWLEPLSLHRAPAIFAAVDASRAALDPWLPWVRHNVTEEHTAAWVRGALAAAGSNPGFQALICTRGKEGVEVAGVIGHVQCRPNEGVTELGYWMNTRHTGRGWMTRATAALTEDAFARLGLHRVEIRCHPENRSSRAIPERLGFTLEGTLRSCATLHGARIDLCVYARLAEEGRLPEMG